MDRQSLALTSQTLYIPNLDPLLAHWHGGVNEKHDAVKAFVDAQLEGLLSDSVGLAKAKAGGLGFFTCCWLPDNTSLPALETAALFCVWVFFWDDAIDGADVAAAGRYRDESLRFARYHLLDTAAAAPAAPNKIGELFAVMAGRVVSACEGDTVRLEGLYQAVEAYMNACVKEAKCREKGELPGVDEFYGFRMHTAAAELFLELSGILNPVTLPEEVFASKELREMRVRASKIAIIINELFSLKKELKDGAPLNLVPVTMNARGLDLAGATKELVDELHTHIRTFDENEAQLRDSTASYFGTDALLGLNRLLADYQAIVTCVLKFSAQSPRYRMLQDKQEDGSFVVAL